MQATPQRGFRELSHTADWQLEVWAPTLAELFTLAALGMYSLANIEISAEPKFNRDLELSTEDLETLLVSFLSELLYFVEDEGLAFDQINLSLDGFQMQAHLSGGKIKRQDKEIKAVTYHNLEISFQDQLYQVQIVFDV
jgi:SHS2 domain-containing protein